jgi:hypothetical protein
LERELETEDLDDQSFGGHIHLGTPQSTINFAQLENNNVSNHAFGQFRKKLSTFLNHTLPAYNIPLPNGKTWLMLAAQDTVSSSIFHSHESLFFTNMSPGSRIPIS